MSENNGNPSPDLRGTKYSEQLIKHVEEDDRPARLIVSEEQREADRQNERHPADDEQSGGKPGRKPLAAIRRYMNSEEEDIPVNETDTSDKNYHQPVTGTPVVSSYRPPETAPAEGTPYVRHRRSSNADLNDGIVPPQNIDGGSTAVWKKEPAASETKRFERPSRDVSPESSPMQDGRPSYSYDDPDSRYIPRGDAPSASYYNEQDEDTYAGEDYKPSPWPKFLVITLILILLAGGVLCVLGWMGYGPLGKLFGATNKNDSTSGTPSQTVYADSTPGNTAAPDDSDPAADDIIREIIQIEGEKCTDLIAKSSTNIKFSVKTATTIEDICLMYEDGEQVAMAEDVSPLNPEEMTQWTWHLTVPSFPEPYRGNLYAAYRTEEGGRWIRSSRYIYVNISDAATPAPQPASPPYSESAEVLSFSYTGGEEGVREFHAECPVTIEFVIVTDTRAADVRLYGESSGAPVNCASLGKKADTSSITWIYSVSFTRPFEDSIYVSLKDSENGEWFTSGVFIYAEITEPAPSPTPDNGGFVLAPNMTAVPSETNTPVPAGTPAATAVPATATPAPATAAPTAVSAVTSAADTARQTTPAPETAPAVTPMPELTASFTDSTDPAALKTTQEAYTFNKKGSKTLTDYSRETGIFAPAPDEYTATAGGVFTFRGDNFRRNAAFGTANISTGKMEMVWEFPLGNIRVKDNSAYRYGVGWGSQPAVIKWPSDIRQMMDLYPAAKDTAKLREVIFAAQDGKVYFLNLLTGEQTRNPIDIGYPMKSSVTVHTKSFPMIAFGQADSTLFSKKGDIGYFVYSLLNSSRLLFINGREQGGAQKQYLNSNGSFDGSALILYDTDAKSTGYDDKLLVAGENGLFYAVSLNTEFDHIGRTLKVDPEIQYIRSKVKAQDEKKTVGMEASIAMYRNYAYMADTYGILKCVDVNTMRIVWSVDCGDNTDATPALDFDENGDLWLYTGNTRAGRAKNAGPVTIRRLNAMTGEEDWTYTIDCVKDNNGFSGCKASPAVGEHSVSNLVYFTVNMTEKGRSAIIALNKNTGREEWRKALDSTAISSPVIVYNDVGNAWLIQADESGVLHMLDARMGIECATLDLGASVQGSPAVYGDMLVIGTGGSDERAGKAVGAMYGIQLK